jgi:dihydroxyacetone kinase-like predicted kinase
MIPIPKFKLEFMLQTFNAQEDVLRGSLAEFGDEIEIAEDDTKAESGKAFKVIMHTEDPASVFDICAQFGRIKTAKVSELGGENG